MHLEAWRREFDLAAFVAKFGRQPARSFDAIDLFEKIEKPVAAMEFAVGADFQPGFLLEHDGAFDRALLDRPQNLRRNFVATAPRARLDNAGRTQQTADHVGVEGRLRPAHGYFLAG